MRTLLTDEPDEAAQIILAGGVVVFPTETVYGLGADTFNIAAVERVFEAKGRPADNPLITHISNRGQIRQLTQDVTAYADLLAEAFFPGPLTLVLPRSPNIPLQVTAGLDTVGVRMPQQLITQAFLRACGTPVAAPSANRSGRPSPTTWEAALEDLDGRVDCVLRGPQSKFGLESTVVDCSGAFPVILRPGVITIDQLREVVPTAATHGDITPDLIRSPGMRHRHYSPSADVVLVSSSDAIPKGLQKGIAFIGLSRAENVSSVKQMICDGTEQYARHLFEFLRECDREGISTIYCEAVAPEGVGAALMDRLIRASETN